MMPLRARIAAAVVAIIGLLLVLAAIMADQAWFDAHFLPVFFITRDDFLLGTWLARLAVGGLGLALLFPLRPVIRRAFARQGWKDLLPQILALALALILALGTGELLLRLRSPRAAEEDPPQQEPLRHHDPILGWTFVPGRSAQAMEGGRMIDYAFDPHGFRVRSLAEPVDPRKPSILFAGESVMEGFGLQWQESIGARTAALLGLQPVNMGVNGYADDQIYGRLKRELPRFARPVAVVILFAPGLMFRDDDIDRPHLGPHLNWHPAEHRLRLLRLLDFYVPYHSSAAMERLVRQVRDQLTASVELARAHHAAVLILVPHFGAIDRREALLRRRILDEGRIPYLWLELDPAWRLPDDPHPDARGADVMAQAIAERLKQARLRAGKDQNI
ncbi:SGNH/GDSL hydrolase family protein [Sphingobium sp. EM0848]|uniref:SGNH/GDSL hydrolase family protein n=1 Tax=Sphingobium sp. EM0848 TaxID=2743473 RepID=UPI00159C2D83|nr:SGNH/GDSL hydrolase family protein [Sphingobium sp. EM0848]